MSYFVYILRSKKDGRVYVGSTGDVSTRLVRHNLGGVPATRHRRPLHLVRVESFEERSSAVRRERFLKTRSGRRELEQTV